MRPREIFLNRYGLVVSYYPICQIDKLGSMRLQGTDVLKMKYGKVRK